MENALKLLLRLVKNAMNVLQRKEKYLSIVCINMVCRGKIKKVLGDLF